MLRRDEPVMQRRDGRPMKYYELLFMLTHDKTQLVWVSDSLRLLWQLGLFTSVV